MGKYWIEIDVPIWIGYTIEANSEEEALDKAYDDFFVRYAKIEDKVNKYFDGRGDAWHTIFKEEK